MYNIIDLKRNIFFLYLFITSIIIIYVIIHYFYGDLKVYLPFYIVSEIGLTSGLIYLVRTDRYEISIFIMFISIAIVTYSVFFYGGLNNLGLLWSILLVAISYYLLPIRLANIFNFSYLFILVITTIAYLIGIINLPYKPISYITFYLAIFLIIYIGNSFIKETINTLNILYKAVNYDALTDVYSRRKLYEILEYEIERIKRYNRPLSIMIIDIDDFKKINDTYGHNFGDEILKEVANILKSNIRKVDSVGRLGGEEFLVILPETTKEEAFFVGEKLRSAVERYFEANYGKKLTISIGISQLDESLLCCEDCEVEKIILDLIEVADKALYIAKRNGKNMVIIS